MKSGITYVRFIVILCGCLFIGCGCASNNRFHPSSVIPAVLSAGGGVLGYQLAKDKSDDTKMAYAAAGAGATFVAAEAVRQKVLKDYDNEFMKGYDLGNSDVVKSLYWQIQDRQRDEKFYKKPKERVRLYTYPASSRVNGTYTGEEPITVRSIEN